MKFQAMLQTRPHPPIRIPRCELILPMPCEWFDLINREGLDVEAMLCSFLCAGDRAFIREMEIREGFAERFAELGAFEIPAAAEAELVRAVIVVRKDFCQCLEIAGAVVGVTPHEVACRILARQIPVFAGEPACGRVAAKLRKVGRNGTKPDCSFFDPAAMRTVQFRVTGEQYSRFSAIAAKFYEGCTDGFGRPHGIDQLARFGLLEQAADLQWVLDPNCERNPKRNETANVIPFFPKRARC